MKPEEQEAAVQKDIWNLNAMGMFFLRHKTKLVDTGFFRDFVDSYSHILPGVDDSIRTIEESLAVLAYFESLGVKNVRLTDKLAREIMSLR